MDRPRRSVEQIEVIEHRIVEEGRRPIGSGAHLPPYSSLRQSTESYEKKAGDLLDKRYEATGERDVSHEASFLHSSANYGQQLEVSPTRSQLFGSGPPLNTSGQRIEFADTVAVNNYGYDVHEVHTSDGGARIVETHGTGPFMEMSRLESTRVDEVVERPGITSALRSGNKDLGYIGGVRTSAGGLRSSSNQVFTVPSPQMTRSESWRHIQSDNESFARKDSYKRMLQSDELITSMENSKSYAPQSQTSLVTRSSKASAQRQEGEGCWQKTKVYFQDLYTTIRGKEMTPHLLANLCCILFLFILLLILIIIILNAIFSRYSVTEFLLFPPVCEECRRKNPALISAALPSSLFIHFYSSAQAHLELRGNLPFKSNSFTAVDFETGYVAIADHALTDANGRHTTCFILPLDRTAIPSMDALREAVGDSDYEIQSHFGWQEFWQFDAEPIDQMMVNSRFTDPIEDCKGAKWYLLKQTVHSRDASCSDCYDFCLPDWAVVRKEKYEDQSTIGVRRLDCFRLYVPEWRNFRVEADLSGGHWQYPLSSQNTKRDKNGEWVAWIPTERSMPSRRKRGILI